MVNSNRCPVIDQILGCICQTCTQTALKPPVSRDFGRNPCHLSGMNESRGTRFEIPTSNDGAKTHPVRLPQTMTFQMYRMLKCHTSAYFQGAGFQGAGFQGAGVTAILLRLCLAALVALFSVCGSVYASQETRVSAVLVALKTDGKAISLNFDSKVDMKIVHLDGPPRILIDLPETNFAAIEKGARLPELVTDIRFGLMTPGQSRIVLTLSMPALATGDEKTGENGAAETHQITFAIVNQAQFSERATADAATFNTLQSTKPDSISVSSGKPAVSGGPQPFTVVIDPGHGGIDSGAEGKLGTLEKDVTLAFGRAIRDALKDAPEVKVVMTRDADVFVGLHERVTIARENGAELFLSVHGDSIRLADVRGATIYTLSDRASDAISSALAKQENLTDSIAGLPPMQPDADTNSILVDLLRQETETFSRELAGQIVVHLEENAVELINNPVRAAGFSVLTAPDVPSLLLEMGYLSNEKDELLLRDPDWRARTAGVIAKAIITYATGHRTRSAQP
jgi:N-acetylmuramoyl-L-alanine amidase